MQVLSQASAQPHGWHPALAKPVPEKSSQLFQNCTAKLGLPESRTFKPLPLQPTNFPFSSREATKMPGVVRASQGVISSEVDRLQDQVKKQILTATQLAELPAKPTAAVGASELERAFEIHDEQYLKPVEGPSVWYGRDFSDKESEWVHVLTSDEVAEIEAAIAGVRASGKQTKDVTQADFPLPNLGPRLLSIRDELVTGRGFYLLKGLPVKRWSREETILAYFGLGTYWGRAVSQNGKGHLIGHVKDLGTDPTNIVNRVYTHHGPQPWHCDSADLVGLLCLQVAKEGGLSSWASSHTVYNELLRSRPDLVRIFSQPWFIDRKNEVPAGKKPYYVMPVFNYYQGRLTIHYENSFFQAAQRHPGVPPLSAERLEAIAEFDRVAGSSPVRLDYWLEVGDLQLLNNHQTVHMRTGYTDWGPGPDEKRHLLRLWLSPPNDRPIHPLYGERYGSTEVGARGGICVPGAATKISLEAE
ncbi:hypothetical protein KFL_003410090 [Klebsormidium nitens]|uniref:TauD/TfdA-like domain-containing protein n=1 Tax=Klebsormidium nitens TaxID=105231 RepID=A0A1Y1IBB3_KLENI|nr:hypothetical protein KFL_003410090 [Klebsormidium nitens]|eukprot:GAQ87252.1 hypothetical protein KFL_003410090 [Klebsormidium nitens]